MQSQFSMRNQAAMGQQTNPPGFAGTLSAEQRSRMLAFLSTAQRTAYDAMSPAQKTVFENDFADAHWDVVSGTSTTAAQAAQTQAYLGATEQALGLTFGAISTAMANNNQQVLEQIRGDAQARIATIQAQLQRDLAPTEATRLRYQLEGLQNTQVLLDQQRNQTGQIVTYVAGAAVVLTGLYLVTRPRENPTVTRGKSRMFVPMHLLNKSEQAKWRGSKGKKAKR